MSGSSVGKPGFVEATTPRKRSLPEQIGWAEKALPDECPAFVVAAAWVIAYRGDKVSTDLILAELKAEGKTKAQLNG